MHFFDTNVSFLIFSFYICAVQHSFAAFMVKINLSDINVPELIPDIWSPLNEEQREFLANHFTLQNYKKNEIIHCEGETPTCPVSYTHLTLPTTPYV